MSRPAFRQTNCQDLETIFFFWFQTISLQICDADAMVGLLNATLVILIFHLNSVWRDAR